MRKAVHWITIFALVLLMSANVFAKEKASQSPLFLLCIGKLYVYEDGGNLMGDTSDHTKWVVKILQNEMLMIYSLPNFGQITAPLKIEPEYYSSEFPINQMHLGQYIHSTKVLINRISGDSIAIINSNNQSGKVGFTGECQNAKAKF